MWLWIVVLALATPPVEVRIAGLGPAKAVQALVRTTEGLRPTGCNDAGQAPDPTVDGIWTCDPVEVPDATAEFFLVVDGRRMQGGFLSWAEGPRIAALQVQLGRVTASTRSELVPTENARPSPQVPNLLVRLLHAGTGPAPILELQAEGQNLPLACHDDGSFPDAERNDGNPACAGAFSANSAAITVKGAQPRSFGPLSWPSAPIRYLSLDLETGTASTEPFAIPLPPLRPPSASPASPAGSPASPAGSPAASVQPRALLPWLLLLTGIVVPFLWLRRRQQQSRRPLNRLRPHAAPPLFPGGPSWAEAAALLRVENPASFVADLLPILSRERRILVVLPDAQVLPPAANVWLAPADWMELRAATLAMARTEGLPVAVLVVGEQTLMDPGAMVRDPMAGLVQSLPPGIALWLVVSDAAQVSAWIPTWRIEGPPWVGKSG